MTKFTINVCPHDAPLAPKALLKRGLTVLISIIAVVSVVGANVQASLADDTSGELKVPSDNRIKILMYDDTDVYTITTRYGYQTNIVFAVQEDIETISVGDRSMWQIVPSGNRLFIRPMEEDVITNMTVLTNKHSYQFDLKSVPSDKTDGVIYVAKFFYKDDKAKLASGSTNVAMNSPYGPNMPPPAPMPAPPGGPMPVSAPFGPAPSVPAPAGTATDPAISSGPPTVVSAPPAVASMPPVIGSAPQAAAQAGNSQLMYGQPAQPVPSSAPFAAVSNAMPPAYPNYNYTYTGPDDMAPLQVYDDGKSTYLKYRYVNQSLPNVFIVDQSGQETPIRYNVRGEFVVVEAVAGIIALKNTSGTVYVYNEMLNPR